MSYNSPDFQIEVHIESSQTVDGTGSRESLARHPYLTQHYFKHKRGFAGFLLEAGDEVTIGGDQGLFCFERIALVDEIATTFVDDDGDWASAWSAEAARRMEAFKRGEIAALDSEAVFDALGKSINVCFS